jgi:SHS2 domain-containing protein
MRKKFKFLEHTADIKFQAFGKDINEVFENVALAISEIIARENKIKLKIKKKIKIKGIDKESLLHNFIEELLYLVDAENFITTKARVKISGNTLEAELQGDKTDNYKGLDHIKAATYAEMYIKKTENGWEAQAVVDV